MSLKRKLVSLLLVVLLAMSSLVTVAYASAGDNAVEGAWQSINGGGYAKSSSQSSNGEATVKLTKQYARSSGGYYTYSELLASTDADGTRTNGIVTSRYDDLTKSAQDDFIGDIWQCLINDEAYCEAQGKHPKSGSSSEDCFSSETANNVYKEATSAIGANSAVISAIMSNQSPDFATAQRILSPVQNILNVFMAILGILLMAFLGITLMLDLAYIALPAFREFLDGGEGSQGGGGSGNSGHKLRRLISDEALKAINTNSNGGGEDKNATLEYMKHKWINLLFFCILLVALVTGRLFTLISSIINLVSGFFD